MVQRVRHALGATPWATTERTVPFTRLYPVAQFADLPRNRLRRGRRPHRTYLQPCSYRSSRRTRAASSVPFVEFVLKSACSFAETRTASMLCAA